MKLNKLITQAVLGSFIGYITMSCQNSDKEINDFLADQNLPITVGENIYHEYKNTGIITSKMFAKVIYDFSNREAHPYSEFPKGIQLVTINKDTRDSTSVYGNYALTYDKTKTSIIEGDVKIINHKENSILETSKLYWDQKLNYYFTNKPFVMYTLTDTIHGVGFESDSNLNNWILNRTNGSLNVKK